MLSIPFLPFPGNKPAAVHPAEASSRCANREMLIFGSLDSLEGSCDQTRETPWRANLTRPGRLPGGLLRHTRETPWRAPVSRPKKPGDYLLSIPLVCRAPSH